MQTLRSESGLIRIEYHDEAALSAHSLPRPWRHPGLQVKLRKIGLLLATAAVSGLLEASGLLAVQWPGLFPLLLLSGAVFQGWQLNQLRQRCFSLTLNSDRLTLRESLDPTAPEISRPCSELKAVCVAYEATGHRSQQAVLSLTGRAGEPPLNWGGGLPETELRWLGEHLQNWLQEVSCCADKKTS